MNILNYFPYSFSFYTPPLHLQSNTILYINLKRPMVFAYTNDLRELAFLNHKIMLKRKMYSDKSFYK
ncbi:hypothetical protein EWM10_08035, partial [Clostridioides difficile]